MATKKATGKAAARKGAGKKVAKKGAAKKAAAKKSSAKTPPTRKPARKASAKPARKPAPRRAAKSAAAPAQVERRRPGSSSLRVQKLAPSFTANDLEASVRFYVDGLGFHLQERWEHEGKLLGVMLVAGGAELGLSQDDFSKGRDRKKGIGCRTWAQTTQSLKSIAERARAAGIDAEVSTEAWGSRTLTVVDPDGFIVTLHNGER